MHSKCTVQLDVLKEEAIAQLAEAIGQVIDVNLIRHIRFQKTYPNSGGPWTTKGQIVMQAFWMFDMDAFVLDVFDDESAEKVQIAAIFAAGKFWSVRKIKIAVEIGEEMKCVVQ